MIALTLTSRPLSDPHALTGLRSVRSSKAVFPRMDRLLRLLQVLQSVVRRVLIDVVDHVPFPHRVVRVSGVPHVLVALYVSVFANRRVKVSFAERDANKHTSFVADPLAATPVGIALRPGSSRDLRSNLSSHAPWRPVGARAGAVRGHAVCRVNASELSPAHRAFLRGFHLPIL